MITIAILAVAVGLLGWGLFRALPYGTPGVLAWLQSVTLMLPWLLVFGLATVGLFLNFAAILVLLAVSIAAYILLGKRLRAIATQSPPASTSSASTKEKSATPENWSSFRQPPGSQPIDMSYFTESKSNREGQADEQVSEASDSGDSELGDDLSRVKADGQPEKGATDPANPENSLPQMPAEDLSIVKGIFGIDTFFAQETVPYQDGAIFKGNLRGDAAQVHERLSAALHEKVGDRYRLYALMGPEGKPVMVVLPSTNDPKPTTPSQWGVAVILAIATITTCLEAAGILNGFDLFQDLGRFQDTWLIGGGVAAILIAHELGHWIKAQQYQIRLSPPFFIPAWQLGSFGALTRFESVLPNRSVLFDISIAGPIVGGIVSLAFLLLGFSLSHQGSVFQVPSEFFQGSILVGTLARVALGNQLQAPLVDIHPLTIVGWIGLVITALNVMPAGQLDGGRFVQSIYGRKVAQWTTVATLVFLGLATFVNSLALYWAILILFLQRDLERPSLDELTEPNDARAALGLLMLFLMAATLLPLTSGLAGQLGIGGK
ncbi:MAG: site-2 protease family protein [Elainellaceae cyanobacterium]